MKFLDWLFNRQEPSILSNLPPAVNPLSRVGKGNFADGPLGLDLEDIPHTSVELDLASDLPGDYRKLHPSDQKQHLKDISVGEDKSIKVDVWQTTWRDKHYTFIAHDGELEIGSWADEDTRRKLNKKFRREFKSD